MEDFDELRAAIDAADQELLSVVARRLGLCARIGEVKRQDGVPLRDEVREEEMIRGWLQTADERGVPASLARRLLQELLVASRGVQADAASHSLRVGYRGMPGAWAELALLRWAESHPERATHGVAFHGLGALFLALASDEIQAVVVPRLNSLVGEVAEVERFLRDGVFVEVAALELPVHHCIAGLESARPEELKRLHSHPLARAQCSERVGDLAFEACRDTASAAAFVALANDPASAALCSPEAARRYGLVVLESRVADTDAGLTRFSVLQRS